MSELGIGRSTVGRAVGSDRPPKYERKPVATSFTPFQPRVRVLLEEHPDMPATGDRGGDGWLGRVDHVVP